MPVGGFNFQTTMLVSKQFFAPTSLPKFICRKRLPALAEKSCHNATDLFINFFLANANSIS